MFTLVISLVVVLGAVTAVTVLVFREIRQPAMDDADPQRATPTRPAASRESSPLPIVTPPPAHLKPRFELRTAEPRRMAVPARVQPSVGRRIRSALALAGLLTALGIGAAVMIGAIVVGLLFVARQALG